MVCDAIMDDKCAKRIALGGQELLDIGDVFRVLVATFEGETFQLTEFRE